jgi:hypothetical protein
MPVIDAGQCAQIPPECPVSAFGVATFKAGRPVDSRWSEMTLRGRKRPGHLHRGEDEPNITSM